MTHDKPKRKYSERRTDLKKEFICQHEGCSRKYSSRIAFNHHLKQKHMAKKLEIQWFSASFIKSNFKFRNSLFIFLCYIKQLIFPSNSFAIIHSSAHSTCPGLPLTPISRHSFKIVKFWFDLVVEKISTKKYSKQKIF